MRPLTTLHLALEVSPPLAMVTRQPMPLDLVTRMPLHLGTTLRPQQCLAQVSMSVESLAVCTPSCMPYV